MNVSGDVGYVSMQTSGNLYNTILEILKTYINYWEKIYTWVSLLYLGFRLSRIQEMPKMQNCIKTNYK